MAKGPGVVLGRKGTLGRTYYVDRDYWPHDTTLWVRDFKGNDPRFVYYFFSNLDFRYLDVGSANPTLNRNHVHPLPTTWPPITEQRAISKVLGDLDDKIASNITVTNLCDVLWRAAASEVLGQLEVDDDKTSEQGGQLLSSLARFVNGRAFTKGATGTGRMVVRIAELNSGPGDATVYNDLEVKDEYLVRPGNLLFAWSGSLTVQRWFREEAIVNQHIFKVVPEPGIPMWLVHAHLLRLLPGYKSIASGKATTMGHIQRRDLDIAVAVPDKPTLANLDAICTPLWERALQAEIESLRLVALRDTLLPQLLSGQVRVRDAEEFVGASV
jgi:type I restriction enzyme S subunit